MEMARSERVANQGRNYGAEQAVRAMKRAKIRPNLAHRRDPAVRYRMANLAPGTKSLDKGALGLTETDLPLAHEAGPTPSTEPTTTAGITAARAGRILSPAELWELLLFISEENKALLENPALPPPLPYHTDYSSTFNSYKRKEAAAALKAAPSDTASVVSNDSSFTFDVRPPLSPRPEKKRKKAKKTKTTTVGSTTTGVSVTNMSSSTPMPTLALISELSLGSWTSICTTSLRSLALTLGNTLKHVSLAHCTSLSNEMLESFAARLYSLESLDLKGCTLIADSGCKSVSEICGTVLTSLDLSHCDRITHDACGWIAGQLGHNRPGCVKLRSLDLSDCPHIGDNALFYLSKGCRKLKYVSLMNDELVTDAGVASLAAGCKLLRVLNLDRCINVHNDGIIAIGMHCANLLSLNARGLSSLTDHALSAIALGCPKLQALNIAGAKKVTEAGLCALAQHCRNLQTLNVGGCELVTRNGLLALIQGLEFVQEARSFFGFIPIDRSTDVKLKTQQQELEHYAAKQVQSCFHNMKVRIEARKMVKFLREDRAALEIQLAFQRYLKRKRQWLVRHEQHRNASIAELQRCLRGFWGRRKARILKEWWAELQANAKYAVFLQAKARGHHVRKHDKLVAPALIVLHQEWEETRKNNASVILQRQVRKMLARMRVTGWREVHVGRKSDVDISIVLLQRQVRAFVSRVKVARLLFASEIVRKLRNRAAIRMQNMYRVSAGKYGGLLKGGEMARVKRLQNRACLHVQRVFRGFCGREERRGVEYGIRAEQDAAGLIQRVFRSTRILHWKDIKMNKVAAFVYKRQQLELQERQRCTDIRNAQRLEGAQQDSASEEETYIDVNDLWQEMYDETLKKPYWYNPSLQTETYERPLVYAFERSLIGLKVRIYWSMMDEYFTGKVTKYNKTKQRWRVNYKDGDHEWVNFDVEHERVQVYSDGSWKMFKLYQPDVVRIVQEKSRAKRKENKEMARKKKMAESWVCLGFNEEEHRSRYFSLMLDEARLGTEKDDFDKWTIRKEEGGEGVWYYFNEVEEKKVVWTEPDPRLSLPVDSDIMKLFKIQLVSDLRYGAYFCRALVDEYFAVENADEKRKILERLRTEEVCKKMAISLVIAQKVWEEKEFNAIPELVECTQLQKVVSELMGHAESQHWEMQKLRKSLLKMGEGKEAVMCPKCSYEVENVSATYCAVCGFKLWGGGGGDTMDEEEKAEHRRLLHRKTDDMNLKVRATFRATQKFESKAGSGAFDGINIDDLNLDDDDDEELGLSDSVGLGQDSIEGLESVDAADV